MSRDITVTRAELASALQRIEGSILALVDVDAALPTESWLDDELREVMHTLAEARHLIKNEIFQGDVDNAVAMKPVTPTPNAGEVST